MAEARPDRQRRVRPDRRRPDQPEPDLRARAAGTVSTASRSAASTARPTAAIRWTQVLAPPNDTTGGADVAIDPSNPQHALRVALGPPAQQRRAHLRRRRLGPLPLDRRRHRRGRGSQNIIVGPLPTLRRRTDGAHRERQPRPDRRRVRTERPEARLRRLRRTRPEPTRASSSRTTAADCSPPAGGRRQQRLRMVVRPAVGRPGRTRTALFNADVNLRALDERRRDVGERRTARTPTSTRWRGTRTSPNQVYLGDDGGVYRSTANGEQHLDPRDVRAVQPGLPRRRRAPTIRTGSSIGLQDNGSNRSWTNGSPTADPAVHFNSLRRRRRALRRDRPVQPHTTTRAARTPCAAARTTSARPRPR